MRRLSLLVLAASVACTSQVTPKNPYDPATPLELQAKAQVQGKVKVPGLAVGGRSVFIRQDGRLLRSFTTDDTGAFIFDSLTPGLYEVVVKVPGFTEAARQFTLSAGKVLDLGDISLEPQAGTNTGSVIGTARLGKMAPSGTPAGTPPEADPSIEHGGILVEAIGTAYTAVTASTGDFTLSLPPDTYTLRITHANYVAATVSDVVVNLGEVRPINLVILATNPATVAGSVLAERPDGTTGPLADAFVTLDGTSATGITDAVGHFSLDQLAPGSYLLRVVKPGYTSATLPVLNLEGGEVRVLADPIPVALQRGGLRGLVVLADTPADASGAVVEVSGTGRAAVTGADGAYAFDALVAGPYQVRVRHDGYGLQVVGGLNVTAGATVDVPLVTLTRQGGTVSIVGGSVTRLLPVTLQLGAPVAASYRASEDPTFKDAALGDVDSAPAHPYPGQGKTVPFTLSDRDGAHDVYVVFIDAQGGASAPASASIVLDRLAPVAPSVTIETGGAFTRNATVGLSLSAQDLPATPGAAVSGLARMEIANNSTYAGSVQVDYNLAHTWTLPAGDGLKGVWVRFIDRAGNVSADATATVTLDNTIPKDAQVVLSGGAAVPAGHTGSPLVTATLLVSDANAGPGSQDMQVRLSSSSGFAGAAWQPYAPQLTWLLPPGDGLKTVYAQFMDPAGNLSLVASGTITLDATAPSAGRLTVAGGAPATKDHLVPVTLAATGATEMRLFVDGAAATGWIPYAVATTVDLGASPDEATRTVSVSFRNAAGVEGAPASASVILDQRAPTAPTLRVNGGASFAGGLPVTLSLSAQDAPVAPGGIASGLDTVEVSNDAGFVVSTVAPAVDSLSWSLATGADGPRTVYARFKDKAGNVSARVSADVVLDTAGPTGAFIALSGGAGAQPGYTATPVVTATLNATDVNEGAAKQNLEVRLGNDAGFSGATWQPYAPTLSWVVPAGDGSKQVFAQFRDQAGKTSLVVSATIQLASTPPSAGTLVLAGGAAATNLASVPAVVSAVGAAEMRFFVDGAAVGGWVAYATTPTVAIGATPNEATRAVTVFFRGASGLEGPSAAATILFDAAKPTGTVSVNGGASFISNPSVTLTLAASDGPAAAGTASGVASVELSNDPGFVPSTTFAYATSIPWTLALPSGADGPRTVYARFKDRAGNVSATASALVNLDKTAPGAPGITLLGNAGAQPGYTGTPVVTASFSATDLNGGAGNANLQLRVSNDPGFAGASWQPFAASLSWALSGTDGPKTVYAQFRDAAANESLIAQANITLAATAPSAGSIALATAATNQPTVNASVAASGAAQMRFLVDGVAATGWLPYDTAPVAVPLGATPDETLRTVAVAFRTLGGVEGGGASGTVLVDRTAPTAPSVTINGGAAWLASALAPVTLAVSALDGPVTGTVASGLATVEVANNNLFTGFVSFPMAATVPWTIPSGDGTKTVWARFRDKAGNVSGSASASIVLDTAGPTSPLISLVGNAEATTGYTGTPVVTATVSATDANEGAGKANLQVRLGNDIGFSGSNWQPYTTALPWVLPLGDGSKTVYVQFRDAAGNTSAINNASIQLLATPPSAGTIALAGGATATNQASVTATVGATNAVQMQLFVNGVAQTAGFVPCATNPTVALGLSPDESTRTVSVVFRSAGGVDGADALSTIVMDHTAPTAPSVTINGGAAWLASTLAPVTLAVSALDGPVTGTVASGLATVEVANNNLFTGFVSFPMAATVPWTIPSGDGTKTVYARFRDKAGNVSGNASASIVLDTAGPTSPLISLVGNAEATTGYTGTPVVTANVSATDVNEGAGKANLQVRLGNDIGFSGSNWQPYTTSLQWVLPTGDGSKTVYVQFRDAAGNLSATNNASIQLQATPPSGGSIVLASGATATSLQVVPATLSAISAAFMRLSVNGTAVTGWLAFTNPTATTVDLGATPDQATRAVSVSFRNNGGVEGGAATTSIRFDKTAPLAGALAVVGTLGNGTTSATLSATPAVVLQVTPPGADEVEMAVAQAAAAATPCASSFATPLWQPISRSATLVLTGADGAKRACVLFRDAAGNFLPANAASANITLDTTPPTNPEFVNVASRTQNGTSVPATGLPQVTASTDATAGGVTYQCVGGVSPSYGPQWVDCGGATTLPAAWKLSPNQESTLGVRARDAAFNYSPGSFARVVHDDVAPFPPFITDLRASRDSVTVTWDATADVDVASYSVYYGNSAADLAGTGAAQGPSPVQVAAVTGQAVGTLTLTGLVPGLPYYLSVEAVDVAGNRSGPGGQRLAVPNKANPRVLSTFAGLPRMVGSATTATRTFLYLAESQGIVQLDVTSDAALPAVVGRAYLPDLVPDQGGPLAVIPCAKGVTAGHCVFPTGTTSEGEYRGDKDNYRAATPIVFFKTTGTGAAPTVGSIEGILPVRPTHVLVGTFGGEKVVFTVDRKSVRAYTFKAGQLAFLRQVASRPISASVLSVYAATLVGTDLYAYMRVDPRDDSAPNLWTFNVATALAGTIGETRHGALLDDRGIPIGDVRFAGSVQQFVPSFYGGVFLSYVSLSPSDQTVLSWYLPGFAGPQDTWTYSSGQGGEGVQPVSTAGGAVDSFGNVSQNLYTFVSSGLGSPALFRLLNDGGLTDEVTVSSATMGDSVAAYAGFNHLNQERLWSIESPAVGTSRNVERYTVSSAAIPAMAHLANPFAEIPPDLFVESDRHLFVASGKTLLTVDTANPYTPNVVQSTSFAAGWGSPYTKLLVHGRFLYAVGGVYMDIYRINGDGSLTWKTFTFDGAGLNAVAVVGRWIFTASGTALRAYDGSGVANGTGPTLLQSLAPGVFINALDARFDNSTAGALGVNPIPNAVVYAVTSGAELRTYGFQGTILSALGSVAWSGDGGTSVRVKGDYAIAATPSGAYPFFVGTPASPFASGPALYPFSGPPLLQDGYVVGLGAVGDANGPVFAGRGQGAVDGAIRFSACTAPGTGAAGSLTHVDGRYAASCGSNGITLFTPVSAEGGRLLKSQDVTVTWNPGAALASDGMLARLAGPVVGNDLSRLYTVDERTLAEGTLSVPGYASTNLQNNGPTGVAGADVNRSASFMVEADGVIYVVTRRIFGSPTVDAFEPSTNPWVYLGRYTFASTADPAAVATDGEYLYVARNNTATLAGQVDVVDIRNPLGMTLRASTGALPGNYSIDALALSRDRLYAALAQGTAELNEVRVWDVSAVPTAGTVTAKATLQMGTEGGITGVAVVGDKLFYTLWDPIYQVPQYEVGVARLGTVDRDGGAGSTVLARLPLATPAQSPVVAGDVLYVASNLGTASFDLAPLWRDGSASVPVGGVNLADPFRTAPVVLRVDGPFATLVGGTYRVFDLR